MAQATTHTSRQRQSTSTDTAPLARSRTQLLRGGHSWGAPSTQVRALSLRPHKLFEKQSFGPSVVGGMVWCVAWRAGCYRRTNLVPGQAGQRHPGQKKDDVVSPESPTRARLARHLTRTTGVCLQKTDREIALVVNAKCFSPLSHMTARQSFVDPEREQDPRSWGIAGRAPGLVGTARAEADNG